MTKSIAILLLIVTSIGRLYAQTSCRLEFKPVFKNQKLDLNHSYVTATGDSIKIETLRLYISNIKLIGKKGNDFSENISYHLLDLEVEQSMTINLTDLPTNSYDKVIFNLGIDSAINVAGALGGVLDPSNGMYWAWQSGYINFKIEGTSPSCKTFKHEFAFHIGGYQLPFNAMRTIQLELTKPVNGLLKIQLDVSKFFESILLSETHTIQIPGYEAMKIADLTSRLFQIK